MNDNLVYSQPIVSNNQIYKWTVPLCLGDYTLFMEDSYGDGWSSGSSLEILLGYQSVGLFSCSNYNTTDHFTVTVAPTQPPCITEEVTFIRKTMTLSGEESFSIIDSTNLTVFSQPEVSDNEHYSWTVSLCHGNYTVVMTDSYGDGWTENSTLIIQYGSFSSEELTCYDSSIALSFTITESPCISQEVTFKIGRAHV